MHFPQAHDTTPKHRCTYEYPMSTQNSPRAADAITRAAMETPRDEQGRTRVQSASRESDEGLRASSRSAAVMVSALPRTPRSRGTSIYLATRAHQTSPTAQYPSSVLCPWGIRWGGRQLQQQSLLGCQKSAKNLKIHPFFLQLSNTNHDICDLSRASAPNAGPAMIKSQMHCTIQQSTGRQQKQQRRWQESSGVDDNRGECR